MFIHKLIVPILLTILLFSLFGFRADASALTFSNHKMTVNGSSTFDVCVLDYDYEDNAYVSLKDVALALKDSGCDFDVSVGDSSVDIVLDKKYSSPKHSPEAWNTEYVSALSVSLKSNPIKINSQDRKYYSIIAKDADGNYDCFMSLLDISMILNIKTRMDEDENISVDTEVLFSLDPVEMEEDGFFQSVNTVLVGNASTGQIYYSFNSENDYPIASTTKLMTYLLTMDAVTDGTITLNQDGVVSEEGQMLSRSQDGVIYMTRGDRIPVSELITAALVRSSNEAALTLAETVSGSEEAFVEKMNEKAASLGMNSAIFYNSNGLPIFTKSIAAAKRQNRMSSEDMFKMVSHILNVYPQITDITSLKKQKLEVLGVEVETTNGVLYNIPECTGLKTGTTTKSGACLVTSLRYNDQDLVVVLLGSEGSMDRIRISEALSRYAISRVSGIESEEDEPILEGKIALEDIVRRVLKKAKAEKSNAMQ